MKVGVMVLGAEIGADFSAANGRGTKVDENKLHCVEVDKNVLGLDVAVDYAMIEQIYVDSD